MKVKLSSVFFVTAGLIFLALFIHGFIALASKVYMDFDQVGMYITATIICVLAGGMIEVIKDAFCKR